MNGVVRLADWRETLSGLADSSASLIVTDPPYASLEKWRGVGTTARMGLGRTGSKSHDPTKFYPTIPDSDIRPLLTECYRVLCSNAHLYMFCDDRTSNLVWQAAEMAGFRVWKRIVWDKIDMGLGYHYWSRYEFILFAEKGRHKLARNDVPDILRFKRIVNGYPTEKPLELVEVLIAQSAPTAGMILDPFCGSGVVAEAAARRGLAFVVGDICPRAIEMTQNRLARLPDVAGQLHVRLL